MPGVPPSWALRTLDPRAAGSVCTVAAGAHGRGQGVLQQVVVGVDPTAAGRRALRTALREAAAHGLPVLAVRAFRARPRTHAGAVAATSRKVAEDMLADARADVPAAAGVATCVAAAPGTPGHVLVDAAGTRSLLVVGSRGTGALARTGLGSASTWALHHARCPVLVVPHGGDAELPPYLRVVVGVDHSPESLRALEHGVREAGVHGAVLVPVFVHDPALTSGAEPDMPLLEAAERHALRAAARAARATGRLDPQVRCGPPGRCLPAEAGPADLLVLGSRGFGSLAGRLLGSTSARAVEDARGPVVVVRSP